MSDPAAERTKSNWHDIEPILKWLAVAYGFGFLIILLHTYRLGIPMLQLIEPANVWIGLPLAVLAYFMDKIYQGAKRSVADFKASIRQASEIRKDLDASSGDLEKLVLMTVDLWFGSLALFAAPVGLLRPAQKTMHWISGKYAEIIRNSAGVNVLRSKSAEFAALPPEERQRLLNSIEPTLKWSLRIAALFRFMNVLVIIIVLVAVCGFYVEAFSSIPQTLGGGRPMPVTLLISPETLPHGGVFEDWWKGIPEGGEGKQAVSIPVTLYLRTEHELLLRKGSGPMISLSDHAIEGIIY